MDDHAYHQAIRRIRRWHFLHYPAQAALMAALVLAAGRRAAPGHAAEPQLATWPALFGVVALLAVVSVLVSFVSSYIKPNLRRPAAENLRLYQGRVFLRDSLLALAGLPPLAAHALHAEALNLLCFAVLLFTLCWLTAPSARTYQRWLIS